MTSGRAKSLSHLATYAALIVICGMAMFPFLWMISTSLKPDSQLVESPPRWMPSEFAWRNYKLARVQRKHRFPALDAQHAHHRRPGGHRHHLLQRRRRLRVCPYPFPRPRRPLRPHAQHHDDSLPRHHGARSSASSSGWASTLPSNGSAPTEPLWAPAWFGSAFSIFLLRQFFTTVPEELSEAARIDGCSEWGIFWRIMLPLSRPALSVVALFTFMWAWRDFLGPLIFLQRPTQYTLTLGLQTFQSQHGSTPWNQLMAASVLVILPVLVLFFIAQKTFIEGIATTGMKG